MPYSPRLSRLPAFAGMATCLLLAGCVTAPKPLQGQYALLAPNTTKDADSGASVRWGGRVVSVEPQADRTCINVIAQPLGANAQPDGSDTSLGRFRACRAGFYDPAVFKANREVTFVGRVEGFDTVRIGDYDYRQPRVAADVVFLWPERRQVDVIIERGWW